MARGPPRTLPWVSFGASTRPRSGPEEVLKGSQMRTKSLVLLSPRRAKTVSEQSRNKFLGANTVMHRDNVGNVKTRSKKVTRKRFWDAYLTLGWPYIRIQKSQISEGIQRVMLSNPDLVTLALGPHHIVRGTWI